jgi:outer membrane protein OmpA-like peptidoglycan-associated protein
MTIFTNLRSPLMFGLIVFIAPLLGCENPQPGPDKTIAGAVLGAGWGAGAGAVVGNQTTNQQGKGVAVGAGLGAAAGMLMGMGYDLEESVQIDHERQLAAMKVQNAANHMELAKLQASLDSPVGPDPIGGVYTVHFDEDQTNLRLGAISALEKVTESIKSGRGYRMVNVMGHTDDTGRADYNEKLAKERADSVAAYLASRGISLDQIRIESFAASRPIATNRTAAGRQLNRRAEVFLSR